MDGILVVDKPAGMTSHDVVDFVRRRFGIRKAGHAGTLDPMATGVLVMLLGRATRESARLVSSEKEYLAALRLGVTTDTGDAWGKVLTIADCQPLPAEKIIGTFAGFVGEIEQIPPMFSAVKSGGKKLYQLARRGMEIERKPRRVTIKEIEVTGINLPEVDFRVVCSGGTYIRSLAVDVGTRLECGAHLSRLRRVRAGAFTIEEAVEIGRLKGISGLELERLLKPPDGKEQPAGEIQVRE